MCSVSVKEKFLNLILIIFILLLISGCYSGATYYYPENLNEMKIIKPEIGIISQISLGEAIINSGYGHYSQGIKILNTISIKNNLGGNITISDGLYELVYSNENECYYTPLDVNQIKYGDPDVNCQIRISDPNKIEIIAEGADLVYSALAIPITQTLNYKKVDSIFISKEDSFQQTMIYSGKSNNIIKFSYREFTDDFIRNSFTTDVSYDLSESNIIGYKNFKAEIIEATNTNLKYKIISSF